MKSKSTAFLLTLLGIIGIAGLQYLYLGKPLKGLLWFFTLGVFGLGTLVDIFTISSDVETYNTKIELDTIRAKALNNASNN
jgi:TM2 domain-containing membrane protein YozV